MTPNEYRGLDGIGLADLIRTGEISARQAAEAAIATIQETNPALNAVIATRFDAALADLNDHGQSPLAGVPFLLKDVNLYSHDMPTRFASKFFADASPKADSDMVARWRAAGLTILGKTNTPEFAAEYVTEPAFYGPTLNPWDKTKTVGGSSGGAAVAVVSGMVPLAHATDLGGSIRIPSACCGTYGFKPTSGLNPVRPHFQAIASGLNSDHVISRSVRDSAASLDITADRKPDGHPSWLSLLEAKLPALRIGIIRADGAGRPADAGFLAALDHVADILRRDGHSLAETLLPDLAVGDWFDWLWVPDILHLVEEQAEQTGRYPAQDDLEPLTMALMNQIRDGGPARLADALARKADYAARFAEQTVEFDLLLMPSLAREPVELGTLAYRAFKDVDTWNEAGFAFSPFAAYANLTGQPAAVIPVSVSSSGLPQTIQIAAHVGRDDLVLQVSRVLEKAFAWSRLRPPVAVA